MTIQDTNGAAALSPVITVLTSTHGDIVKRFTYEDGAVCVHPSAQIYDGFAQSTVVGSPSKLAALLEGLAPNEAIALGRLSRIGPKLSLSSEQYRRDGQISRTKQFFGWSEGPSWALLDVDTKGLPTSILNRVAGCDLAEIIIDVVPEIASAPRVVRASSSAGILMPNGQMRQASGLHIYVLVAKGRDIPFFLRLIHNRLWAAGLGYFATSKSGSLLERSLVDLSVGSPERLIFAAPPVVVHPLTRNPPPTVLSDGVQPLAEIIDADPEVVLRLKSEARRQITPDANLKKRQHEEEQVERVSSTLGISKAEALRIVKKRQNSQVLADDDILETGRQRFERVGDFLDRVTGPAGMPCPIEGSSYGPTTAYYYPADAHSPTPRIVSFAHGQVKEFSFERFRKLRGLRWIEPR